MYLGVDVNRALRSFFLNSGSEWRLPTEVFLEGEHLVICCCSALSSRLSVTDNLTHRAHHTLHSPHPQPTHFFKFFILSPFNPRKTFVLLWTMPKTHLKKFYQEQETLSISTMTGKSLKIYYYCTSHGTYNLKVYYQRYERAQLLSFHDSVFSVWICSVFCSSVDLINFFLNTPVSVAA